MKKVAITGENRHKDPRDNQNTCIPRLSLSLLIRLNKDKNRVYPLTIFDRNRLSQPIVLSCSVETFKAVVSSIKYVFNLF